MTSIETTTTHYATARKIAVVFSALGWLLLAFSALLLIGGAIFTLVPMGGGFKLISPTFASFLMPSFWGAALSLLIILGGHVARAVFDIADAAITKRNHNA